MKQKNNDSIITINNQSATLSVDLFGGAIVDFHLIKAFVNPLSFCFTKTQMPANNKAGAPYQGHFACIGRWGEPSAGEIKAGLPNHGEAANILWQQEQMGKGNLSTQAVCKKEGLHVARTINLNKESAVFSVEETISNINNLGRLYNVVQHPTIAAPFLSGETIVNCNAAKGFEYRNADDHKKHLVNFPTVRDDHEKPYNLSKPTLVYNSVFSFVVKQTDDFGWITAYSPVHHLLLGYVWPRKQYPWISLWQHFEDGKIKYRGLEFGTTGIHQPVKNIVEKNLLNVLNEQTVRFIDAGEKQQFEYAGFLCHTPQNFISAKNIQVINNEIILTPTNSKQKVSVGKIKNG
ncbi:MAG TPA: hypothetical protein PKM63_13725 [Panacibacter sp.]|mgnify:CR=1 FL=1|nr:hypothetical protein [Panacibacter sp.]HNP45343.1 hypothetical protein [Panacibacter sp.]